MPKTKSTIPTVEFVRENLSYDPLTGDFWWKTPGSRRNLDRPAGSISTQGYRVLGISGKLYKAHRLAWLITHGVWPTNQIDHRNGTRSDNRLCNLREATNGTNQENQRRGRSNNTAGYLGVYRASTSSKFRAVIQVAGTRHHLGVYATAEEAHQVYLQAKRRLHAGNTL